LPLHLKVKDSNPATAAGAGKSFGFSKRDERSGDDLLRNQQQLFNQNGYYLKVLFLVKNLVIHVCNLMAAWSVG
jgi:hypothetical protein